MPRRGVGLPQMDIDAPRVLANAMLYELDRVAHSVSSGDYVRFMDDIDVGVNSIPEAKAILRDLDLTLQSRQLRLNSAKTRILRVSDREAARHFCIRENRFLDYAARALKQGTPQAKRSVGRALLWAYAQWRGGPKFERSRFLEGNGEKIFKYLSGLMKHAGISIPRADLVWLIRNSPSLREFCFSALTLVENPLEELRELADDFRRGRFVDDASYLNMASFLVHARFARTPAATKCIRDLIADFLEDGGYFKVFAAIVIASKYSTPRGVVDLARKTADLWADDLWMARAVAGLSPLVATRKRLLKEFQDIGQAAHNAEWHSVFDYHRAIRSDPRAVAGVASYASAGNPSFAFGMYHPKALTILSIRQNRSAAARYASILARHPALTDDPYYRPLFH
jgi:hypothetical protein